MKESQIQNAILEFLLYNGVFCWRSNNVPVYDQTAKRYRRMPKFSLKGVADILGIYKGRPLAIEVKKERQYPSREQYAFLNQFKDEGGTAFVARSIEDVKKHLNL